MEHKSTEYIESYLGVSLQVRIFLVRSMAFMWNTYTCCIFDSSLRRPLIKHVVMAYGVDVPTEVGYVYKKKVAPESEGNPDGIPNLHKVIWESANGELHLEAMEATRSSLTELFVKKRRKRELLKRGSSLHSGDGSVPYLSLSFAHTWLLHAARALRHSGEAPANNPLNDIDVSHRPKGATEWVEGAPPKQADSVDGTTNKAESDTGTNHPHGTKYKPEMHRYHNVGQSRTTGIEYTTTVIEAIGVEHKETTRCVRGEGTLPILGLFPIAFCCLR